MKKAVLIRLDKIGDLICTLPMDQVAALHDWEITWVIAKGLRFVPEHSVPPRKFIELDKSGSPEARATFDHFLKEFQPAVAVSFQAPWWVHYALWKNRVARRIGVLSKWHSFLFLNEGLRQKRSEALKHEADYNLDLIKKISPSEITETKAPVLSLSAKPNPDLLKLHGLAASAYDVVHPGMAGSSLNWPVSHYKELILKLLVHRKVVLTGTLADEPWLQELKETFQSEPKVVCLQNKLNSSELLQVLQQAHRVFAPSTGVLHLAASLGAPTVGFFSPIRVQTMTRWGARGKKVHLLSPGVPCPAIHKCHGEACPFYNCMKKITPEQALQEWF
jgi:ADP-heptose:LPS heptosyltransferase